MLENGIVRYVLIAGAFMFATLNFVATPPAKDFNERVQHPAPSHIVSLASTDTPVKTH
jgi:hypothetical protein